MTTPAMADEKSGMGYIESALDKGAINDTRLDQDADMATSGEHNLRLIDAFRKYWPSVLWSMVISASIVMEGYDTTLIGSFFGYPSFQRKYGQYYGPETGYQVPAKWQTGLNDAGAVGNIIGALLNGYFTPIYGHRKVMRVNLILMIAFVFMTFFAPNIQVLLAGEFLCSIPWGVFTTSGPAYAAEVTPLALRGYLTAYVNLCWAIGQLLSAAILKGLLDRTDSLGYKIPFAIQWVWPVPLLIAVFFCPESPWFLVRKGRLDEAEHSLSRLSRGVSHVEHKNMVALMVRTTNLEKDMKTGTSYWHCFKGTNLRRSEIAMIAFASQVTNGGAFAYSPTYFFTTAGISPSASYGIALGGTGIAFIGTCLSWFLMPHFGRRKIFLTGYTLLIIYLYLIAILACTKGADTHSVQYTQATLCLLWLATYSMTTGPIVYTIVAEIGATQLRTQTVVLGRSAYYVANIIGGVLEPYMINPSQWNLKGKTAFFWGTTLLITTIWAYFRLPETKDRTFEELDILFEKRISARNFSKYHIESNSEAVHDIVEHKGESSTTGMSLGDVTPERK